MSNHFHYCVSFLVVLCWLSSRALGKNATSNNNETAHHSVADKRVEHFFEDYGDGKGSIIASQFCNFTKRLSACASKPSGDGHGHGAERTEEQLVEGHEDEEEEGHHDEKEGDNEDEEGHEECESVYNVLKVNNFTETSKINEDDFSKLCPALYALFVGQIKELGTEEHVDEDIMKISQGEVWGYATAAITIISLSSLVVIAIIPLLGKAFYNKLMSFLVALAIGCLAGDALLHLIPHSLVPHSEHNHDEEAAKEDKQALFRAFIIFVGIYVFFIVECCMKLKLARRKKVDTRILYGAGKQQIQQIAGMNESTRLSNAIEAVAEDPEVPPLEPSRKSLNAFMMEVTSGNRRSSRQVRDSLWMAYMAAIDDNGELTSFPEEGLPAPVQREHYRGNRESRIGRKIETLREENSREDLLADIPETNHKASTEKDIGSPDGTANNKANVTDTESQETQSNHNNNHDSHNHNHSHGQPKEIDKTTKIASLAWMVIVGDGFHNLADGLAVGAAFSASFTSGLSTAVAVFCHELPHELGDFAVLVKAGMTVKQAITYNMVSAVISFLGMIVGILIGSNESSIVWVLALTAGMFLYISLVDMLPELCTQLAEEDFKTGLWTFFYQNLGILTGVLIMYLISLME